MHYTSSIVSCYDIDNQSRIMKYRYNVLRTGSFMYTDCQRYLLTVDRIELMEL